MPKDPWQLPTLCSETTPHVLLHALSICHAVQSTHLMIKFLWSPSRLNRKPFDHLSDEILKYDILIADANWFFWLMALSKGFQGHTRAGAVPHLSHPSILGGWKDLMKV